MPINQRLHHALVVSGLLVSGYLVGSFLPWPFESWLYPTATNGGAPAKFSPLVTFLVFLMVFSFMGFFAALGAWIAGFCLPVKPVRYVFCMPLFGLGVTIAVGKFLLGYFTSVNLLHPAMYTATFVAGSVASIAARALGLGLGWARMPYGPGLCPVCGYDLRGQAEGRPCPECGHASGDVP